MATKPATTTDRELLTRAQMRPVWDAEGNLVGITELKVASDRRLGIQAMKDLVATTAEGDHVVGADGWTGKQRRIVSTKAPNACHYLKTSQRWDAAAGAMVPRVTILLPTEVVWTMFDLLFDGQYSVKVVDLQCEEEEVMPSSEEWMGDKPDNMPGRRFYARARVELVIHLASGQSRSYEGFGVAFGDVPMNKIGNIAAINNEQRTTEKGAIADAKREALANIGPVFRRAFEDGDEMIAEIEKMLLEDLQERNRPKIQVVGGRDAVPAPASRKTPAASKEEADTAADTRPEELKEDDLDEVFGPAEGTPAADKPKQKPAAEKPKAKAVAEKPKEKSEAPKPKEAPKDFLVSPEGERIEVDAKTCLTAFLDMAMGYCETPDDLDALRTKNEDVLGRLISDDSDIKALRADMEALDDGVPDFDVPDSAEPTPVQDGPSASENQEPAEDAEEEGDDFVIDVAKKSGKAVLGEFTSLFEAARSPGDINRIIEQNGPAVRKLTPKQLQTMTDRKMEAMSRLSE